MSGVIDIISDAPLAYALGLASMVALAALLAVGNAVVDAVVDWRASRQEKPDKHKRIRKAGGWKDDHTD